MNEYTKVLNERKRTLEAAIRQADSFLRNAPAGRIRTTANGKGYPQFYHVTNETGSAGKYINKKDEHLLKSLIQKEYSIKFIEKAKQELGYIDSIFRFNASDSAEYTPQMLSVLKRKFVAPYLIRDETFAESWEQESFKTNEYRPEEKKYPTKNGEMVRSKSEAIIADMYYDLGIPYRYECELILKDGRIKYPDFTLLDVSRRKVIYHEHMGLLDDEEYRNANLLKINEYRKNGIYSGKNLLITFETELCPLNILDIRRSIKEMLCYN